MSAAFRESIPACGIKGAILSLRSASLIKSVPFESENGRDNGLLLRKVAPKFKLLAWYCVTKVNVVYTIFQCVSFSVNLCTTGFDTDTTIQTITLVMATLSVLIFRNNLLQAKGIVWEVNQLWLMLERHGKQGHAFLFKNCPLRSVSLPDPHLGRRKWNDYPFIVFSTTYVACFFHLFCVPAVLVIIAFKRDSSFTIYLPCTTVTVEIF